jgi:hypothetical protein
MDHQEVNSGYSLPLIFKQAEERMAICRECPRLFQPTRTCKECGCFMLVKTKVPVMSCPLGKWGPMEKDLDTSASV